MSARHEARAFQRVIHGFDPKDGRRVEFTELAFEEVARAVRVAAVFVEDDEEARELLLQFAAVAEQFFSIDLASDFPDASELHSAMLADGFAVKSHGLPSGWREALAGRLSVVKLSSRWALLHLVRWFVDRRERVRNPYLRGRVNDRAVDGAPSTTAWCECHADWLSRAARFIELAKAADEFSGPLSRRFEVLAHEQRERAEVERQAREVSDRVRKAEVRRAMADAARSASKVLGYCVPTVRDFDDVRPRWFYVLLGHDGLLYAGSSLDVRARLRAHRRGTGAAVTRDNRQPWYLLHAERFFVGSAAVAAEFAFLHSVRLQEALLFQVAARARRMHARFGCAVPWLGLVAR